MIDLELKLKLLTHEISNIFVRIWYAIVLALIFSISLTQKIMDYPLLFSLFLLDITEKLNDHRINLFGMSLAKTVYKHMILTNNK